MSNSNFLSTSLNNSILDLMSGTSDSYPIGPESSDITSTNLIYGSFMCLGDLLIQFTSNQTFNGAALTSAGACLFPIPMSGNYLPNTFLITGDNQTSTGGSIVTANFVSQSRFNYSNLPSAGSYINFLCISPRPTYFKPKVPFITTGSPYIYWSDAITLKITYTNTVNTGTITFVDKTSIDKFEIELMTGGGGGGGGATGGYYNGNKYGGAGGSGGRSYRKTVDVSNVIDLNTKYYCHVGAGGAGGGSKRWNFTDGARVGKDGDDGGNSFVGINGNDDTDNLVKLDGSNIRDDDTGEVYGGTGGVGGVQPSDFDNISDYNIVHTKSTDPGSGGLGGNSLYNNNGQKGGNTGNQTDINDIFYQFAAGGGGGKYNNGSIGDGGIGVLRYGSGGDGGQNNSTGSDAVDTTIIGYDAISRGGGGGGGGGGNCNSAGEGSTSGAGGRGGDGYIQFILTFSSQT